jgi:hypothetical protein
MKKLTDLLKRVPWWGYVLGIVYFALQYGMYRLGNLLSVVLGTISYAFEWKIAPIDDLFPVIPAFSLIYIYSYVFWIMGPMAVSITKRRNFINYICGLTLAYIIGFLFFVFMPTYMDRVKEGLMEYADKTGFLNQLLASVFAADGGTMAFNLFPSYHCLISVYCWLGVWKQPEISKGFQMYSLIMFILIVLSTLFTKQHYIPDCFGGIGIAVFCYWLMNRLDPGKKWEEKHS